MASRACFFTRSDNRLATRAVARKLKSATQFCGSAIVNSPMGGKKKKLKVSVAARDASEASMSPQVLAIIRTNSRYANPVVVGFSGIKRYAANVMSAATAREK